MTDLSGPEDDLVLIGLPEILRRRQLDSLTPPMAREDVLPCGLLAPPVFERLALEYLLATEHPRSPAIYGKSGYAQYGLDVVGTDRISGDVFVAQCRRLESIGPAAIRNAVIGYAGAPLAAGPAAPGKRRFGAKRFLLVTAARTWDDPAITDEVFKLNEEYAGDLVVEVHGAELISEMVAVSARTLARKHRELFVVSDIDQETRKLRGTLDGRRRTFVMSAMNPQLRRITVTEAESGLEPLAVFIGHGGRMLGPSSWYRIRCEAWERMRTHAGDNGTSLMPGKRWRWHDLRHSFALQLLSYLEHQMNGEEPDAVTRRRRHLAYLAGTSNTIRC